MNIGPMPDWRIMDYCTNGRMIDPFIPSQVAKSAADGNRFLSYGLSSFGYDIRVAGEFKVFANLYHGVIDPKDFTTLQFHECTVKDHETLVIPPNAFALARSVEYFCIPKNVVGICLGKSTYARCGLIANITALEPEWEGYLTIELSNTAPLPLKVYSGEGIAQVIFFESADACSWSYKDKHGKYQGQTGITLPKV